MYRRIEPFSSPGHVQQIAPGYQIKSEYTGLGNLLV